MTYGNNQQGFRVSEEIGFIGLGVMGQPMALNLVKAGAKLVVWNRSADRAEPLRDAGATVASSVEDVFAQARIVFLMLANEAAVDMVMRRRTPGFRGLVTGHVLVSMGSNSPVYSRRLAADIQDGGGRHVEAPVSGSRKPAEAGQPVSLLGGDRQTIAEVRPLLPPDAKQRVMRIALALIALAAGTLGGARPAPVPVTVDSTRSLAPVDARAITRGRHQIRYKFSGTGCGCLLQRNRNRGLR